MLILVLVGILIFLIVIRKNKSQLLPPGDTAIPFIGQTFQFYAPFDTKNMHPFMVKQVQRYGKVFTSHLIGQPSIVSVDPGIIKNVLSSEWSSFVVAYPPFVAKIIGSIVDSNVEDWKIHQRAIVAFVQSNLKTKLLEHVQVCVAGVIGSWSSEQVVTLVDQTKLITFQVAVEGLLGCKLEQPKLESLLKQMRFMSENIGSIPLNVLGTTYYKTLQVRKQVMAHLSLLISSKTEFIRRLEGQGITGERLLDVLTGFIFAAFDTAGTTMAVAIKYIKDHPIVLEKLKAEHYAIRATKAEGELLTWSDYKSMTFTQDVVNETLRRGSLGFVLFRKAKHDYPIADFVIPKGWTFIASAIGVHHDSDLFEDPLAFNPWRWSEGNAKIDNLLAFGAGPRMCPGMDLARLEVSMFLYYFLTNIRSWEDVEPSQILLDRSIKIPNGLPIFITK